MSAHAIEHAIPDQCQVLISTSTLAWGVNFPAHLAGLTEIPKGSQVFEGLGFGVNGSTLGVYSRACYYGVSKYPRK